MNTQLKKLGKQLIAGILTISSGLCFAQQDRNVGEFTGIDASNSFSIFITQGEKSSIKIEGISTEESEKIKTEIKEDVLFITLSNSTTQFTGDPKISITVKELKYLNAGGATVIRSTADIKVDKLNVISDGAANVKLSLNATEITAKVSGAAQMKLSGKSKSLDADVSGAGNLKARELETEIVKANVSGAGSAKVNVTQQLYAKATGAGNINYTGEPLKKEIDYSGAGTPET